MHNLTQQERKMIVYPVYFNDGSGDGDRHCGTFDSKETAFFYIDQQSYSWYYRWYSETVKTLADLEE